MQSGHAGAAGAGAQVGGRAVSVGGSTNPVSDCQSQGQMASPRQDSLWTWSESWLCAPSAGAPYAAGSDPAIPLLCAVLLLLGLSFYSLCRSWLIVKTELQFNLLCSLGS